MGDIEKFRDRAKQMERVEYDTQNDFEYIAKHSGKTSQVLYEPIYEANVILFSYNRPRMLREAMKNVLIDSTYKKVALWLVDDGSDVFDIDDVVKEFSDPRVILCKAPKISLEERINPASERFQDNANYVLSQIPRDNAFVTYLCDDDLYHPDWLSICNQAFVDNSSYHMVNGRVYYFFDGEDILKDGKEGFLSKMHEENPYAEPNDMYIWWQVGSFAHKLDCYWDENVVWGVGRGGAHSWDVEYCKSLWRAHQSYIIVTTPSLYRREHPNTLSARLGRINDEGLYANSPQPLRPEMLKGSME